MGLLLPSTSLWATNDGAEEDVNVFDKGLGVVCCVKDRLLCQNYEYNLS